MLAGQPMPPRAVLLVTWVLIALLFAAGTRVHAGNSDIVAAARSQIGVTTSYDPAYRQLPDPNIDHRRVPNLMTFFARAGYAVPFTRVAADYLPGDIVAWDLGRGILHIGIVSDILTVAGAPSVVHNIGAGTREEDILFRYAIIGHYRLPPPPAGVAAQPPVSTH